MSANVPGGDVGGEWGLGDEEFQSSVHASASKADDNVGLNCCTGR